MKWRILLPAACLIFCSLLPAASFPDTVLKTTVTWNATAYSPETSYYLVTTGLPSGIYFNPSPTCGASGQPTCVVTVLSAPGCSTGTQCGNFTFNSNTFGAELGSSLQGYLFSGTTENITSPGTYSFTSSSLEYSQPGFNTTLTNIGGEVTVSAAPEPSSWALLVAGMVGLGLCLQERQRRPAIR